MFQHDSFFFIGVFIFIFILWLVLGGPVRPLSFGGPLLSGPGALGGGTYLSLPHAPSIGPSNIDQSHASGISTGGTQTGITYQDQQALDAAIKAAAFGAPSPYRGTVTMNHYVSSAAASNPQNEYLQISLSSNAPGPVTLTGWTVSSDVTGKGSVIPQGTEVPRSGIVNANEPIILYPGDQAILSSGRSPIGASFRENSCIGYFAQFQNFSPTLPNSCPMPNSELETHYGANLVADPTCSDYVDRLYRCSVVLSPPVQLSNVCQTFLTNYLNYNGCVTTHEHDYNFKGATWRVYLGRDSSIWRTSREVVKLIDASGKTVDMFTY